MKKVIEQDNFYDLTVINDNGNKTIKNWSQGINIEKSKAREVALAICPELGEPTIKTDNTKVILHLESELKEAVELIELYIEKSTHRENGMIYINDFELFEKFNTFLTKHKSKE